MSYFSIHNHTHYSNLRLLDSINKPKDLINQAIEYGLNGVCLTDHEALCGHVEFLSYYNDKIKEKYPDFKIGLGNEIYLTKTRDRKQKYYHFLLLAKNDTGHKALRELSSMAWYHMYYDRGMDRVPTLYDELKSIVEKYPNSLIGSTACLGGKLPSLVLDLLHAERNTNMQDIITIKTEIQDFILYMKSLFKDDFYIEVAPGLSKEQIHYNQRVLSIANAYNVKIVVGTDSHYATKEDRFVHKSYLNAQDGEREIDDFYEFCYLMKPEDVIELLYASYDNKEIIDDILNNTMDIYRKIEGYELFKTPVIPREKVKVYPKDILHLDNYPFLDKMDKSDNVQDRYWVNQCIEGLLSHDLYNDEYLKRLDIEADVLLHISAGLKDDLTAYFNSFQSYIDLFWECGSIVGPGRGSSVGFLSDFCLGITQVDPIKYDLPWFRFLNKDRVELPKQYWAV